MRSDRGGLLAHLGAESGREEAAERARAKQGATGALGAQGPPSGGECGGHCPVPTSATSFLPLDSPGTLLLGSPEPDGFCWSVLKEGL